jgi:hypothetical protein
LSLRRVGGGDNEGQAFLFAFGSHASMNAWSLSNRSAWRWGFSLWRYDNAHVHPPLLHSSSDKNGTRTRGMEWNHWFMQQSAFFPVNTDDRFGTPDGLKGLSWMFE